MDIDVLFDLQDDERLSRVERDCVNALIEATTDWPTGLKSLKEYFTEVKQFLKVEALSYQVIEAALVQLNPARYAWQVESLCGLMKIGAADGQRLMDEQWVCELVEQLKEPNGKG